MAAYQTFNVRFPYVQHFAKLPIHQLDNFGVFYFVIKK